MEKESSKNVVGIFLLILLLYCSAWLITKDILLHITPIWASAARMTVSFFAFLLIVLMRPDTCVPLPVVKQKIGYIIALSLLGFGLYFVLTFFALKELHPSELTIILSLIPAITYFLGILFFSEKKELIKMLGLLLATSAALIFSLTRNHYEFSGAGLGICLALLAAICYALYGLLLKAKMSNVPMLGLMSLLTGISMVLMTVLAIWIEPVPNSVSWLIIFEIVLVGATMSAPTYLLYGKLVIKGGPLVASLIGITAPFIILFVERLLGIRQSIFFKDLLLMTICFFGVIIIQMQVLRRPS